MFYVCRAYVEQSRTCIVSSLILLQLHNINCYLFASAMSVVISILPKNPPHLLLVEEKVPNEHFLCCGVG